MLIQNLLRTLWSRGPCLPLTLGVIWVYQVIAGKTLLQGEIYPLKGFLPVNECRLCVPHLVKTCESLRETSLDFFRPLCFGSGALPYVCHRQMSSAY